MRSWIRTPRSRGDPGEAAAQLGRVEDDVPAGRPVQAGVPERGVDLGLRRVAVEELERLAVLGRLVDPGPELLDLVRPGRRATSVPVSSRSQSMPCVAGERDRGPAGSSMPSRSRRPGDLSRLDVAFFNVNGYIAVIVLAAVVTRTMASVRQGGSRAARCSPRIAGRYDLMNGIMTGGRHHAWRRIATGRRRRRPPAPRSISPPAPAISPSPCARADPRRFVVGADFSEAMLRHAEAKRAARGERGIALLAADALALPFADAYLRLRGLGLPAAEPRRPRRRAGGDAPGDAPGGLVAALEITRPGVRGWDAMFGLYFNRVVPLIGAAVARDRAAYTYLPQSVERFVTPPQLATMMERAGLQHVRYRRLGLGTIAIHVGTA